MNRKRILSLVGASHHTASVDLRERLTVPEANLPTALHHLTDDGAEAMLLSTCNRTEVYLVAAEPATEATLAHLCDVDPASLAGCCYAFQEEEAVRHLLRVASGLDSMVLGETQILGQVRDAFETAVAAASIGRVLGRVLPLALEVGKRARTETSISRRSLSPSAVAVQLAREALGDLREATALVLGAGEAGRATAQSLKEAGIRHILVANRSAERGEDLAQLIGGEPLPYDALLDGLVAADIVISSTGAADHVVTAQLVREAVALRSQRRLLCVDIAVPRDIDPEVALIPSVTLHNIDDLEAICETNLRDRANEIASVETIVADGLADYVEWRGVEPMVPTIGALYQRADAIRRSELERTVARLPGLSPDERDLLDVMTASLVRRILHTPVAAIKARGGDPRAHELASLAQELFSLSADPDP
jgi:glutamyl-tRNA reductase